MGQNDVGSELLDKERDALLDLATANTDFVWTNESVDSDILHSKVGANTVAGAPDKQGYPTV